MYERCKFNSRIQGPEESVDSFITDLHTIARKCEYGAIQDELVRDRIVCGIKNKTLSVQIHNMESEPSLDTVTNRVRHSELVAANQHLLRQQQTVEVNQIKRKANQKFTRNAPTPITSLCPPRDVPATPTIEDAGRPQTLSDSPIPSPTRRHAPPDAATASRRSTRATQKPKCGDPTCHSRHS